MKTPIWLVNQTTERMLPPYKKIWSAPQALYWLETQNHEKKEGLCVWYHTTSHVEVLLSSPAVSFTSSRLSGSPAPGPSCTKATTSSGLEGAEVLSSRDLGECHWASPSHRTCRSKSSSRESIVSSKNRRTSFSSCVRYFRLSSSCTKGSGVRNEIKPTVASQKGKNPQQHRDQYRNQGGNHFPPGKCTLSYL